MDTRQKLSILSDDARYDLSCACGGKGTDGRKRGEDGTWVYPASLARGGRDVLLKTLVSNHCSNDCRYCPLRADRDVRRCTLSPEETATSFLDYYRRGGVFGLFLTSGVLGSPDATMERLTATARVLRRKHGYRGYLHMKIVPGASDAAIDEALSLSSMVSLNVEVPHAAAMARLSGRKDFQRDIVGPLRRIATLTSPGGPFRKVKQSTQFIVGAAGETDRQIVEATWGLYRRLRLNRVYYSAYQQGLGEASLPGEQTSGGADLLTREHRLYQVDFLLRRYKWDLADMLFEPDGSLSLAKDPKQRWADAHPERFPVRLRTASRAELLRVPGLGPTWVDRLLTARREGSFRSLGGIGLRGKPLEKVRPYVTMT